MCNESVAALGNMAVLLEQVNVTRPAVGFGEHDQVQTGRISRAIVGRMRNLVEMRQLTKAHLMENLARLRITVSLPPRAVMPSCLTSLIWWLLPSNGRLQDRTDRIFSKR